MERIHKEWYKKDLNEPNNHGGVVSYSEPDILECEVKWALGRPPNTHKERERKETDTRVAWW